jgi:diguanylate cyclase (GGDEF)-like protein/PAS domain S-box-containing protein
MSPDDTRELSRFTAATIAVVMTFAVAGIPLYFETGDATNIAGASVMAILSGLLFYGRRQLIRGRAGRAALVIVAGWLAAVLVAAAIPPPVPALAAAPILGVAFALAFMRGRRLTIALVAAWLVAIATAIVVEVTPTTPDMPVEVGAALRVGGMAGVVGLVALVLARHRHRLEVAITGAQAAGDALRESEARYRSVVEDVRDVIFRIDAKGRWVLLNRAWEELTHQPVAECLGRALLDFVHPDDRRHHADLVLPVGADSPTEYRRELRLAAVGQPIWVEVHARPLHDDAGTFLGVSGTLTDVTVRRALEERLLRQAFRDDLTGLANRALFKNRLEHALTREAVRPSLVALLFLDVDRFKTINDSLGHSAGDGILRAIADRLRIVLRPEDTIARLGGDEFAIVVEGLMAPEEALVIAERIRQSFEAPFAHGDREIVIRSSIGVVVASGGDRSADELLRDADVAMYRAKAGGRGSYALFEPSMQAEVAARMELEADLREAVACDQLTLAYQPIVSLADRRVVGVEALARWHHQRRGDVSPAVFIRSAEESGLIVTLGRWVLRRACREVAELRAQGTEPDLRLSINVSPHQLRERSFVGDVLEALRASGLPASALTLEVTESVVLDCGDEGIAYLRELRAAGCSVSLDDFGTGFSSLENLRTLPIDEIKIDVRFVRAVLEGGVDAAVITAIIGLGAALGVAVVAEGIETTAIADRLEALECPFGQGYLFGRPEPAMALTDRRWRVPGTPVAPLTLPTAGLLRGAPHPARQTLSVKRPACSRAPTVGAGRRHRLTTAASRSYPRPD